MQEQEKSSSRTSDQDLQQSNGTRDDDLIEVVDRKGNKKTVTRAHYEKKKRNRKKRERHSGISLKSVLSIVIILSIMIVAVYISLKVIQ